MGRMEIIRPILALIHVGSAMIYVTGYASTKTLTALAVAAPKPSRRRWLLDLSGVFDFRFQILGGTLLGPSGLLLTLANGYSLTQTWVLLSIVIFAAITFIGAVIWRRRSAMVREALEADDDARLLGLLQDPRARLLTWIEFALIVAVIVLMVLRPG
jgi:uncharacterized membrane protein